MGRKRSDIDQAIREHDKTGNHLGRAVGFGILFFVLGGLTEFLGLHPLIKLASWVLTLGPAFVFGSIFLFRFVKDLLFPANLD